MNTSKSGIQNYINHIAFIIDSSGSMACFQEEVVKVFDSQVKNLAQKSKELNQETRVSVYLFNDEVDCFIYDMDVLRLPSLKNYYSPKGATNLIGATFKAIEDLEKVPQLYGDSSYLVYVVSDGLNNRGNYTPLELANKINSLFDNWTIAAFAPDSQAVRELISCGFVAGNIAQWDIAKGMNAVNNVISQVTNSYMVNRSKGIRGTKSLFTVDTSHLNSKVVNNILEELKPFEYGIYNVRNQAVIKPFIESRTMRDYVKGSAYYQLVKREEIQDYKQICIQNKKNGKVYSGNNARKLIGLPSKTIKVDPANHGDFNIFVQSTSVNRNLPANSQVIVIK